MRVLIAAILWMLLAVTAFAQPSTPPPPAPNPLANLAKIPMFPPTEICAKHPEIMWKLPEHGMFRAATCAEVLALFASNPPPPQPAPPPQSMEMATKRPPPHWMVEPASPDVARDSNTMHSAFATELGAADPIMVYCGLHPSVILSVTNSANKPLFRIICPKT